jgi:hypothetical protein
MLKRLGLGLLKGLLLGGAVGAGLQYGLRWTDVSGLLGFLIAMGVAGTTGVFAGRPPWQEGAWIEATLKGLVGVGLGALVYWVASRWGQFEIPFPGLREPASWTELPVVFAPAIAGLYGSLVELDNTGERGEEKEGARPAAKARVEVEDELELEEEPVSRRGAKNNRQT